MHAAGRGVHGVVSLVVNERIYVTRAFKPVECLHIADDDRGRVNLRLRRHNDRGDDERDNREAANDSGGGTNAPIAALARLLFLKRLDFFEPARFALLLDRGTGLL